MSSPGDVIVVGGGPSGLAAAHGLAQAGVPVRILEAADQVGGKMRTSRRGGFLVDEGAFFIPSNHRALLTLAAEVGMAGDVVEGEFILGVVRDGVIHNLDGNHLFGSIAATRLLSMRAKAELVKLVPELVRARRGKYARISELGAYDTETVSGWAASRFSAELREYLIETTIRGIAATSGDTASRVDFLAILALLSGAKLLAFREGMGSYAHRLAKDAKTEVGAEVTSVDAGPGGVTVTWTDSGGAVRIDRAAACVVATPAQTVARIVPGLDDFRRSYLGLVRNGRLLVLNVGLSQPLRGVDSTYILVPRATHPFLTGIMLDHHKAPRRAPADKALLTVAVLDSWSADHWSDSDDQIRDAVLAALQKVLPAAVDHIEFAEVQRWREEYFTVGCYRDLGHFRELCEQDQRVQLAGDFHSFQNLESATISGQRAAERLLRGRVVG